MALWKVRYRKKNSGTVYTETINCASPSEAKEELKSRIPNVNISDVSQGYC
tara:strand:- start:420 stop:572 length:153 start_codon:yes stop_codon:yes gene_type:complete